MTASLEILSLFIQALTPQVQKRRDSQRRKNGLPIGGPDLKRGRKSGEVAAAVREALEKGGRTDSQVARAHGVSRQFVYSVRHSYVRPDRR